MGQYCIGGNIQWVPLNQVEDGIYTKVPLFCVTGDGDSFLLVENHDGKRHLQVFNKPDDVIESFLVTYEEMTKDLGILPQALSITKKSSSALAQPSLPPPNKSADDDSCKVEEHYAIKHFRLQSRTALSIRTLLDAAIAALKIGDTDKADEVLAEVELSAQDHIEAAAEAATT